MARTGRERDTGDAVFQVPNGMCSSCSGPNKTPFPMTNVCVELLVVGEQIWG